MLEWSYSGINISLPGAGGPECAGYTPWSQRLYEAIFAAGLSFVLIKWSWRRLKSTAPLIVKDYQYSYKQTLLVLHCLVFGVELGFKLASGSLIWVLNPCHIITIIQIILLSCRPCKEVACLFRLHMHLLNGPLLALAFPVLNTRLLPFECAVYFVQHILLLLIPIVILDQSTIYSVEPVDDLSWVVFSVGLQLVYHFIFLLPLALITGINLNNMLCPAVSDPFSGPHYRVIAMLHQTALILVLGKCVACFALTWNGQSLPWSIIPSEPSPVQKFSLSKHAAETALLDTLLDSDRELVTDLSLAASSWCWSDLFRYQTYLYDKAHQPYGTSKDTSSMDESSPPKLASSVARRRSKEDEVVGRDKRQT
ncbi:unnamed protein product [Calicophoron daubneyi]|uniref:Transmembrane protein 164 n=1 Tax=Calicophoron daubneyi TaxID=300641 RepID=A0AAV2TLG6_CALDB